MKYLYLNFVAKIRILFDISLFLLQYLLFFRVNVCTMLYIIPIPLSHSRPYLGRVGLSRDTFSFHER